LNLELIWRELRNDPRAHATGVIRRRLRPESPCDLYLGVERPGDLPLLILTVPEDTIADLPHLPSSTGVETVISDGGHGRADVTLRLADPRYTDIFETLAADLVAAVDGVTGPDACAPAFINRFLSWQRFLQRAGSEGLNSWAQMGLYGELWFLKNHLLEWLPAERAVTSWTGPLGANQDFQPWAVGIEIKCTGTKLPLRVQINNERQLDGTGTEGLFLCVLTLDVRDGSEGTLPQIVGELRSSLIPSPPAASGFDERLITMGYLNAHESRYADRAYALRDVRMFRVGPGFPRIIESDVRAGVGDVRYSIGVSDCRPFTVEIEDVKTEVIEHASG